MFLSTVHVQPCHRFSASPEDLGIVVSVLPCNPLGNMQALSQQLLEQVALGASSALYSWLGTC